MAECILSRRQWTAVMSKGGGGGGRGGGTSAGLTYVEQAGKGN